MELLSSGTPCDTRKDGSAAGHGGTRKHAAAARSRCSRRCSVGSLMDRSAPTKISICGISRLARLLSVAAVATEHSRFPASPHVTCGCITIAPRPRRLASHSNYPIISNNQVDSYSCAALPALPPPRRARARAHSALSPLHLHAQTYACPCTCTCPCNSAHAHGTDVRATAASQARTCFKEMRYSG